MPIEKINAAGGYNNLFGVTAVNAHGETTFFSSSASLEVASDLNLALAASGNYQFRFDDYGLRRKTVNIGSWDMKSTYYKKVPNPLTINQKWKNTRGLNLIVRDDSDAVYYTSDTAPGVSGLTDVSVSGITDTHITLKRRDGGYFDSNDFNSSANRGWVTMWYV